MTFKIFVGGQRVKSEEVLGRCWGAVRVRVEVARDARRRRRDAETDEEVVRDDRAIGTGRNERDTVTGARAGPRGRVTRTRGRTGRTRASRARNARHVTKDRV